jgi:hypothetical protein
MTKTERDARMYAAHLGLIVRGSVGAFELSERYGPPHGKKRKIGTYRTVKTLEAGILRFNTGMCVQMATRDGRRRYEEGIFDRFNKKRRGGRRLTTQHAA